MTTETKEGDIKTGETKVGQMRNQLCFSVYSTSIAINRLYKPILDPLGLTYPQYLVLAALWEEDAQSIGTIADRLALESSTITPLVKRLEAGGFVARKRCPNDERQVHVRLTPQGRAVREKTFCLKEAMLEKTCMTEQDIIRLNEDIQRLLCGLTKQVDAG